MSQTPSFAWAAAVAPHAVAATAARDVLIEGGNAIEAAIAAAAVTSVVASELGGAGGDAVWVIREAGARGRTRVLDARGPVGDAVTLRHFRERDLRAIPSLGADSIVTVPGAVAGWRAALELSQALGGKLPVRRLLEPAIAAARDGYAAQDPQAWPLPSALPDGLGFAEAYLVDGKRPEAGSLRRMPAWGETLGYLAQSGLEDFCAGDVGREIAQDLRAIGSLLSRDDVRHFVPRWRDPWSLRVRYGLVEVPPTRTALAFLLSVGLFERLPAASPGSAAHLHNRIEASKRAAAMLVEADEAGTDVADLLEPLKLQSESEQMDAARAAPGGLPHRMPEASVWIGVVDAQGLAVSLVASLGTAFGSGCLLPKTGVLMGNRGSRFELDDDNDLVLRRGRRVAMDGLPVIVAGDRGGVMSLGTSAWPLAGGIAAHLGAGAGLSEAIEAPRMLSAALSMSDGSVVFVEDGFDPSALSVLSRAGHEIRGMDRSSAGGAGAVRRLADGRVEAAPDPRQDAVAAGV